MPELLLPGQAERDPPETPFDRNFFLRQFHSDEPPACELYEQGEIPVVELELTNGETPDVYYFEAFRRDYLVALLFLDPPKCTDFYRSYIRYETIFRVNIRYYPGATRELGFKPAVPETDEETPLALPEKG
jgi:hypothetical protein